MNTIRSIAVLTLIGALAGSVHAQNISASFGGIRNAVDFAYGLTQGVPALNVAPNSTNATTGTSTITLNTGTVAAANQAPFNPLTTTTPITVGFGSNQETVTPTAVSGCGQGQPIGSCQVTAAFTKLHGPNEPVTTGTYGLQEALNSANTAGGGRVAVSPTWTTLGGTNATITAAVAYSNVTIEDNRTSPLAPYWTMQPTTLTVVAPPTTLTATNIVFTAATGTWAASSTHFTATCVDAMGGESAASADYTQTPTLNYTLTVPVPPTCSTGAVGWRLYAGTASAAVSYLMPANTTTCPGGLSTETVIPACSLTSTGIWAATFTTTTLQAPVALGVTNTKNPVPQSHQTFGYQPSGTPGYTFVTKYGPFGSGTIASATAADITPLGSFELPTGFLNELGRTIRVTGKIQGGETATGTLGIFIGTVWAGGVTAGLPITVCNPTSAAAAGTVNYTWSFSCTMTTNAVGATAVGSIQPDSWFMGGGASGTTVMLGTEASLTAVGSLGLFAQDHFDVYITPTTEAVTAARLMNLSIEVLQ